MQRVEPARRNRWEALSLCRYCCTWSKSYILIEPVGNVYTCTLIMPSIHTRLLFPKPSQPPYRIISTDASFPVLYSLYNSTSCPMKKPKPHNENSPHLSQLTRYQFSCSCRHTSKKIFPCFDVRGGILPENVFSIFSTLHVMNGILPLFRSRGSIPNIQQNLSKHDKCSWKYS